MSDFEDDEVDIYHVDDLSKDFKSFLYNSELSDVTFNVEDVIFKAHKFILSARSEYFRTMFASSFHEAEDPEISIQDTTAEAFGTMLQYFYCGSVNLRTLSVSDTIQFLKLASLYREDALFSAIEDYLKTWVQCDQSKKIAEVLLVLSNAIVFSMTELVEICHEFLDLNARSVLECEEFKKLPRELFELILKRESYQALAIDVLHAEEEWTANKNKEESSRTSAPPSKKLLKRLFDWIFVPTREKRQEKCTFEASETLSNPRKLLNSLHNEPRRKCFSS